MNQSNVISFKILKIKKQNVQKLIENLSFCFSNYTFLSISLRNFMSHLKLHSKSQTFVFIFHLFFNSFLFSIMTNNINIKTKIKRVKIIHHQNSWHHLNSTEIETFVKILLYMKIFLMTRNVNYWNHDFKRAVHNSIVNCMSRSRWQQLKKYLKIFNFLKNEK